MTNNTDKPVESKEFVTRQVLQFVESQVKKTVLLYQKKFDRLVSKTLRTLMYSCRRVNGLTRQKLECVQPVPWKTRLEMLIGMQNENLIGIMKLLF